MADTKITGLQTPGAFPVVPSTDVLPIVIVADNSMAASGSTRKVTVNQILGAGGTATLASATITGDLTVRTNLLAVTSTGVGFGTAAPSGPFHIRNAGAQQRWDSGGATDARVELWANSLRQGLIGWNTNQIIFGGDSSRNTVMTWQDVGGVAGTAMTLNATGLGVGGSPTRKLSIVGSGATYANINSGDNTSLVGLLLGGTSAPSAGQVIYDNTAASLSLFTNGASRFLIDSSGNVGVGVTPSAWGNNFKVVQVGQAGSIYGAAALGYYGTKFNLYNDNTNNIAITTNYVGEYRFEVLNGNHVWLNKSTAGSVGVAQTLTQAMTLDASGNLLVGTTTAGGNRLNVQTASGDCTTLIKSQAANVNSAIDYVSNYGNHTIRKSGTAVWDFGVINDASATPAFKISNASAVGVQLVSGATAWTTLSDETVKDIIEPIGNAVAKVGSLRSVIGKFKTDSEGTRRSFLIAQDVKSVLPEAVDVVGENNELGLRYTEVIPLLVAAIKELTARVEALEA